MAKTSLTHDRDVTTLTLEQREWIRRQGASGQGAGGSATEALQPVRAEHHQARARRLRAAAQLPVTSNGIFCPAA